MTLPEAAAIDPTLARLTSDEEFTLIDIASNEELASRGSLALGAGAWCEVLRNFTENMGESLEVGPARVVASLHAQRTLVFAMRGTQVLVLATEELGTLGRLVSIARVWATADQD